MGGNVKFIVSKVVLMTSVFINVPPCPFPYLGLEDLFPWRCFFSTIFWLNMASPGETEEVGGGLRRCRWCHCWCSTWSKRSGDLVGWDGVRWCQVWFRFVTKKSSTATGPSMLFPVLFVSMLCLQDPFSTLHSSLWGATSGSVLWRVGLP